MSDTNDLRLFQELRLHPWKPADKVKIDAHLAMFGVTNPRLAAELAQKYGAKLDAYLAAHKPVKAELPALTKEEKAEVKEIVQEVVEKVKPKKLKKLLSPSSDAHL